MAIVPAPFHGRQNAALHMRRPNAPSEMPRANNVRLYTIGLSYIPFP